MKNQIFNVFSSPTRRDLGQSIQLRLLFSKSPKSTLTATDQVT